MDIAIDLGKRKSYVVMEDNDRLVKEIHRNYKRRVLYFLRKGGKSEDYSGGQLFPHVTENFAVQHEAKFLADSAYDAATIRQRVHDAGMRDVIAVNGRAITVRRRRRTTITGPDGSSSRRIPCWRCGTT